MRARQREAGAGVIERRASPCCCGVTALTGRREGRLYVIRAGSALEIWHMAGRARRIGSGQPVIVVHVARRTRRAYMCAGQREARRSVIERRAAPIRCRMAGFASRRERRLHVVRADCILKVGHMAG